MDNNTLFIFPCSDKKEPGGHEWQTDENGLKKLIPLESYSKVLRARANLLNILKSNNKYLTGKKYSKNKYIKFGPDFGGDDTSGKYMPAIERYKGKLYKAFPDFSELIRESLSNPNSPHMLILSALYGPLHPLDMIQDYNLKMEKDNPAQRIWKEHFPFFLRDYATKNKLTTVNLYFGISTPYLKIANLAVISLKGILKRATVYGIKNGSLYHTPHNHGLLIANHLGEKKNISFTRKRKPKILL